MGHWLPSFGVDRIQYPRSSSAVFDRIPTRVRDLTQAKYFLTDAEETIMTNNDTDTDRQSRELASARRQAILANPDGVELPKIMDALDTLTDDHFEQWLDEHPEVRAQVRARVQNVFDALREVFETIPEEEWDAYNQRVAFALDDGVYEHTVLETADGERYPAGLIGVWGTTFDGQRSLDIRERNIPDGAELVGSRVEIRNDTGILLLAGEIVEEGGRMAGEGIINNQSVVVEPDG